MTGTAGTERVATNIAPWLSVAGATKAVDFYKAAFDAVELYRLEEAGAVAVAQLAIDGADFWVQHDTDSSPDAAPGGRLSVRMILTVDDPDSLFAQALAAGATEIAPSRRDTVGGWDESKTPSAITGRSGSPSRRDAVLIARGPEN